MYDLPGSIHVDLETSSRHTPLGDFFLSRQCNLRPLEREALIPFTDHRMDSPESGTATVVGVDIIFLSQPQYTSNIILILVKTHACCTNCKA